jgi:hypothetical protein
VKVVPTSAPLTKGVMTVEPALWRTLYPAKQL